MNKLAIIIPCFNEQHALPAVIAEINMINRVADFEYFPIVINDASTDNTFDVAQKLNCVILNLPVNLGIGGAVETGLKYAFENNFDYALQLDGDGQHPPGEIEKLIHHLLTNKLDVVIGSRFLLKSGFQSTLMRCAGINFFRILIMALTGKRISDATSGFRLLNRKAIELANKYYPDEYPEPEAVILFVKNNIQLGEVSVNMRERAGGTSSIGAFASLYYMFKVSIAIIFTFIRSNK